MRSIHMWLGLILVATLVLVPVVASAQMKPPATATAAKTKPAPAKTPTAPAVTATVPGVLPSVTPTMAGTLEPVVTPTAAEIVPPRTFPFTGFINAETVYIRSGPGLYYYPLTNLPKDTELTVLGEAGGWLAVAPPPAVFGLVRKADVVLAPDGKAASVDVDAARLYAGSDTAARQWCVMATLAKGDALKVLGTAAGGDMLKVVPPASGRVYVAAAYVTSGASPNGPPIKIEPIQIDPLIGELRKIDEAILAESQKPVAQQNYTLISVALKNIGAKTDKDYLKTAVEDREAFIRNATNSQREYEKAMEIQRQLEKQLANIRAEEAAKVAAAEKDKKNVRVEFVGTGVIQPIASLDTVDYPIKYKLVDRDGKELMVLKSAVYDLSKFVGKVVGIRGQKAFMPEWRLYCVTVDDLEVLE